MNEGETGGQKESGEREEGEGKEEEEEDLDTTLDYLGLSQESIGEVMYQALDVI